MSVIVDTENEDSFEYADGLDWYIDEAGRLHVRDAAKKHIAAYNRTAWSSARVHENKTQRTVTVKLEADTSAFDKALARAAEDAQRLGGRNE